MAAAKVPGKGTETQNRKEGSCCGFWEGASVWGRASGCEREETGSVWVKSLCCGREETDSV